MVDNTLQHLTYGRAIVGEVPEEAANILAITDTLTADQLSNLRVAVSLAPMPVDKLFESQAIAFAPYRIDGQYVLARSHFQRAERTMPAAQYILLPAEIMSQLADIKDLLPLIDTAIPTSKVFHAPVEPLAPPTVTNWSAANDIAALRHVLSKHANDDIDLLFATLGAILQTGVIICNFVMNWRERIQFVSAIIALLPVPLRHRISFTTYTNNLSGALPRLVFSSVDNESKHVRLDWGSKEFDAELLNHPHVAHLRTLWNDDLSSLVDHIQAIGVYSTSQQQLSDLEALAMRHQHDIAVRHHDVISIEHMLDVLQSDTPPLGDLYRQYIERLFQETLAVRDADAAVYLANIFDADEELNNYAQAVMFEHLKKQPDAVYAFIRARLAQSIDEKWLMWLKAAAASSLEIALQTGDANTLANWLTLIGREPLRYELSEVLHEGILGAIEIAYTHADIAKQLITLAIKRQPETLDTLLSDERLTQQLPENVQSVLATYDTQAIDAVAMEWREFFLLTLHRAIEAQKQCISPVAMRQLWTIQVQNNNNTLPPQYRPVTLIQQFAQDNACLLDGALETLLTLILRDKEDTFFLEIATALHENEQLAPVLAPALTQSGRDQESVITIVSTLVRQEHLEPQQASTVYSALIGQRSNENAPILLEQMGRVLSQYPDVTAPQDVLWRMVDYASETKNDQIMRAANRRLLALFNDMLAEDALVENIQRLRKATTWSQTGKTALNKWWRDYARQQSVGQLQKLDKALEGNRNLDDLRSVAQTLIAMRRVVGTRTLAEFAEDVATTFTILQALSENFDPEGKTTMSVDSATIRGELTARAEELAGETRHVLATNLKELAQLVTTLAENRSKPTLIRNDDTVERQLAKGQQQPQSAIDVMRWLSGYFDGLQPDDETEE